MLSKSCPMPLTVLQPETSVRLSIMIVASKMFLIFRIFLKMDT